MLENFINKVIQGDCLEVMKGIPDEAIDMILCDLPYGTTQNKWDSIIDLPKLWEQYERIIKPNGAIVLTAQGLFTAKLIISNEKFFKYKIVWIKSKATNFLNANKQPLRKHEDICVFYKKQPTYHPQMTMGQPYDKGMRKDQNTGSYGEFNTHHVKSEGLRYPNDTLFDDLSNDDLSFREQLRNPILGKIIDLEENLEDFIYVKTAEAEGEVFHPTQKPVELGRYLIKTFTNEGELVLDNTCGSGSFLVAACLEKRKFIGIEKNADTILHKDKSIDLIKICNKRLKSALKTLNEKTKNLSSNDNKLEEKSTNFLF